MQPGHVLLQVGHQGRRHGQSSQHAACSLPTNEPCTTFPRPDLTGQNHQTCIAQQPGRRTVIAHGQMVPHLAVLAVASPAPRRRVKVIGPLPGATSCLALMWAALDRASRGWRGFTMTSEGLRLLQDLRRSLLGPPRRLRPRTVATAEAASSLETVSTVA
jgi:hypothetical protein